VTEIPWIAGSFRHVLAPPSMPQPESGKPASQWYINDHCMLIDSFGRIHWFGINNPYPEDGNLYGPGSHRHIGHAVAECPWGPWIALEDAFSLPPGTTENVGACFVVPYGSEYRMIYGYNTGFYFARSDDLNVWQRYPLRFWIWARTREIHVSGNRRMARTCSMLPPAIRARAPLPWQKAAISYGGIRQRQRFYPTWRSSGAHWSRRLYTDGMTSSTSSLTTVIGSTRRLWFSTAETPAASIGRRRFARSLRMPRRFLSGEGEHTLRTAALRTGTGLISAPRRVCGWQNFNGHSPDRPRCHRRQLAKARPS